MASIECFAYSSLQVKFVAWLLS